MAERDYSHVPLARKLGIRAGARVTVLGSGRPPTLSLGPLPDGVDVAESVRPETDVAVLLADEAQKLREAFDGVARSLTPAGGLWVAWPKRSSGVATDIDFDCVQGIGLAAGLVDNKVCSIDATWTAVRFVTRRRDRAR